MTHLEQYLAMLEEAGISHELDLTDRESKRSVQAGVPEGAVSVHAPADDQPHEGGYLFFWAELVFGPDDRLWAVWAWE